MQRLACLTLLTVTALCAADKGFISLFNGKDLTGWKVNENQETFSVQDGAIVAHGQRSHCFYVGDVGNHTFKNFHLKADVMTLPGSNGGIYFATEYQDKSWPVKGFEAQVNNTFKGDHRKTASLYQVQDNETEVAADNKWFTEEIIVNGRNVTIKVDGKDIVKWTEPADWQGTKEFPGRRISPGTIALQGHDKNSTVYYKNIRIKLLK
ncbi:MAG TPA: DUF1080 domain-containing protein [Bryobacteraceae bacterium]|nr:DUF1080 domain-containing protein [Bryobacteraceae bacterium]